MIIPCSLTAATVHDLPALEGVHRAAFPTDLEAQLVRLLVIRGKAGVSLKAIVDGKIVGHVVFSPAASEAPAVQRQGADVSLREATTMGLGLAPLAVVPTYQRQGIGTALVRAGIAACQTLGIPWIVVLGDPAYYRRFGFVPASRYGLSGEFGGDAKFQALILGKGEPPIRGGHIRYAREFREVFGG